MKEGLSKFLLKKKIFSLILVASIIFGMLPATASAALGTGLQIGETSKNEDTKTEPRTSLSDGEIWVDKSVEYVSDGTFEITLSAAGQKYSIGNQVPGERADVVLMLDTSMSMGSGRNSKLENMKTAAQSAVDKLLGVEGNRVALVTFNSVATLSNDFTYDINALKGKIGNLKTASGTNIQNAFLVAQNALLNRNDRSRIPVIILLSDGAPSYYYESLTNHDNRKPNYPTESNEAVWWTIQQAMETKRVIADNLKDNDGPNELKIYTIGFGVGTNNRAIATLMPTEGNTENYRPTVYSAKTRLVTETANFEYKMVSYNNYSLKYDISIQRGSSSKEYGPESLVTGLTSEPQNTSWTDPTREGLVIKAGNKYYFKGTRTRTEYFDIQSEKAGFDHKYWEEGSSLTSTDVSSLMAVFTNITNNITGYQPHNSDIVIEDVLGEGFEVVGTPDTSLSHSGNKITWTIDGDDFVTMEPGSELLDSSKIKTISFKVKIRDDAVAREERYETNASAQAIFNVADDNSFYKERGEKDKNGNVTVPLTNTGWLTLEELDDPVVTLTIKKQFTAPLPEDVTETFSFNIYRDEVNAGNLLKTVSITVPDESNSGKAQEIVTINDLKWSDFEEGKVTLYVEEVQGDSKYWNYDNDIKTVEVSPNKLCGKVFFRNTYTPPGTITVTKVWDTGSGEDESYWPEDVKLVTVYLREEIEAEDQVPEFQGFMMSAFEGDGDDGDEDEIIDEVEDENDGDVDDVDVDEVEDENDGDVDVVDVDEVEDENDGDVDDVDVDEAEDENDGDVDDVDVDEAEDENDGEVLTQKAQLLFSAPGATSKGECTTLTLTRDNPSVSFDQAVKKDGYRYYISEVKVDEYITEMSAGEKGDVEPCGNGEYEITLDEDGSAEIIITNTANNPSIEITKKVLNSPQTLTGGTATLKYELVVTNTGNTTLENVTVEDEMSGPDTDPEYSEDAETKFYIEKMEPGESRPITYSVIVDKAGEYTNKATATCWYKDKPITDTSDEVTATVNPEYVPPVTPPVTPPSGGGGGYTPSQGTVKVNYVDVNGNALADGDELTGIVGTDYSTSAKTIDGYTLTAVPENAEGTFVNGVIMVTYKYNAENTDIEIEEEEIPEAVPEEQIIDEELPEALPQTGLPIVTIPELFGGALIAIGLYFGRKKKEDEE